MIDMLSRNGHSNGTAHERNGRKPQAAHQDRPPPTGALELATELAARITGHQLWPFAAKIILGLQNEPPASSPAKEPAEDVHTLASQLFTVLLGKRPELVRLAAAIAARTHPCRHSRDFASVSWHGQSYTFSPSQAAAVKLLWQAWRNGTPELRQETILQAVSSDGNRLSDLFREHPAWGKLIVAGQAKGTFRLAEPEK